MIAAFLAGCAPILPHPDAGRSFAIQHHDFAFIRALAGARLHCERIGLEAQHIHTDSKPSRFRSRLIAPPGTSISEVMMFQVMVEWLDEGKTRARFSLPGREEWKVEHIDALMQVLGEIRAEMTPAVPEEPPQLQDVRFLHAPRYRTTLHEFSGGSLIQFRHPSLGWLPFLLPSVERKRIVEYFSTQEDEWEHRHGR